MTTIMQPRTRDAAATRQRILDVATAEFARYGFAGGRVDRIAAAAGANKTLIYRYFGSKDGLFDAAVDAAIARNVEAVPIDSGDLPGWAVRLADLYRRDPTADRLSRWDALERAGRAHRVPAIAANRARKIEAIRTAQAAGVVAADLPPEILLQTIYALALARMAPGVDDLDDPDPDQHLHAVVSRLIRPVQP
ncbi:MAG TPA: TetR family transcriptional regulator [Thermomicrobiales bacterium]|nr:TetR family transcriptional regulator [Thermomicrobiales bacterium]